MRDREKGCCVGVRVLDRMREGMGDRQRKGRKGEKETETEKER